MDEARHSRRGVALILALLIVFLCPGYAAADIDDTACSTPVFLNGERLYVQNGPAGLPSVAADAARSLCTADVAILPAFCFLSSLPEGAVTYDALNRSVPAHETLVLTEMTGLEIQTLLDQTLVLGSDLFPHVSGMTVFGQRILTNEGEPAGTVETLHVGAAPAEADELYAVVTTKSLTERGAWFTRTARDLDLTLQDALTTYLNSAETEAIASAALSQRVTIASDLVDTNLVLHELTLPLPVPVRINLDSPDVISDSVFFLLKGQERSLEAIIWDSEFPYMLSFPGQDLHESVGNVDTKVSVTQTLPVARKTANTFDENTLFVDLRYNTSIPGHTLISIDLQKIYEPGMTLYVYYYDENGDIVFSDQSVVVSEDDTITFEVAPGTTYVVNSRALNHAATFSTPTPDHPFSAGIAVILTAFFVWLAAFFYSRHSKKRRDLKRDTSS